MLGPQCCEKPPVLNPLSWSGHVEKLGGLDVYVSGSPSRIFMVNTTSSFFVFDLIESYEAPNLRALADKVAASGFYVVVPDYFYGDPYDPSHQDRPVPVWIKDHGPDKGFEDTKPVLEAIKNKGITAIGAAGMCWGGKVVVELSKEELIQAAVLLHPTYVTVDDIKEHMSGPQCCENPPALNPVSGSGHVEKLGGLDAYVSGSLDSKLCVILISDVFGYEAPNLR
ncbi:hypothetical protein F2Q69_00053648 [Brassica cretica]|uniref:Dienelactone hydrolase domain-containing protein n=1 Tax=Brassica cretica TaxID=69181 RepID=A0A8S9N2K5_BRACR|nr:hypothetical protein F2Q69_00053648 [Brassica cretica]